MTPAPAVTAIGFALPELRLTREEVTAAWGHSAARDVKRRALPAFDEDEVTLGVLAGRRALEAGALDAADLALVVVATGTGGRATAVTVADALGAGNARVVHVTGRQAAGVNALLAAYRDVAATGRAALAVAADVPRSAPGDAAEHGEGAAAAAFLVSGDAAGVTLEAAGGAASDLPGASVLDDEGYRRSPDVTVADPDLPRRALAGVLPDGTALDFAVTHPGGFPVRDAGGKPVAPARDAPAARPVVGDAGAAAVALDLVAALADARPGTHGLVAVADESGDAVALRLGVGAAPRGDGAVADAARGGREVSYLRALQERGVLLGVAGVPDEPMGAYVSLPDFARSLPERYRLQATRCTACDCVQFPRKSTCPGCGAGEFHAVTLSGRGSLYSVTTIGRGGAPSEFAAEQAMTGAYLSAIVELEEGPRVAARLAGFAPEDAVVGAPVRTVLRRLYTQQGVTRYGFKFAPA